MILSTPPRLEYGHQESVIITMNARYQIFVLRLLALFIPLAHAFAQQAIKVPASEAARHVVKSAPPTYSQFALMAHIQGKVALALTIAPDGSVTQLRAVSGHPVLIPAALDAVTQWKYTPFLVDGAAVPAQTSVYLLFALGPEAGLQQEYFAQEIACRDLLKTDRFEDAATSCGAALRTAKELKTDLLGFKMNAFANAGLAAYHLNNFPEAIECFEGRLKQAQHDLRSDDGDWFDAHHDLALALQASGQSEPADAQYRESEKSLNAESKWLENSQAHKDYVERRQAQIRATMKATLIEHAALLRRMGRSSEADDLEQRANSLKVDR